MEKKLFIGWPIYGQVDSHFFKCALKYVAEFGQNTSIFPCIGDSLIPRARNLISWMFLKSDCTHLLMIDSDIIFSSEQIQRLLSHDEAIVGGFYPKKQISPAQFVCNTLPDSKPPREDGLQEMKYMGSGFLLIRRDVFEAVISEFGKSIVYARDGSKEIEHDFWPVGVYQFKDLTRRYLSEDWYFCQRAIDLGFKIWGDTHIRLKHSGNIVYPLPEQEATLFKTPEGKPALNIPKEAEFEEDQIFKKGSYEFGVDLNPTTILDAGAHVGLFSIWASKKWPDAKIHSFEPVPENYEKFKHNIIGRENITLHPEALFSHTGEIVMRRGQHSMMHSFRKELAGGQQMILPCVDSATVGKFDLVKIDTEGAELNILRNLDLSETKAVVCEAHGLQDLSLIDALLTSKGFSIESVEPSVKDCWVIKALAKVPELVSK